MRQVRVALVAAVVGTMAMVAFNSQSAQAYNDFFKVFEKKYVGDASNPTQQKIAAAIKDVKKCFVCHDPRKIDGKVSKKNRNEYGKALSEFLTKTDKKDLAKIEKALETVSSKKAADSKTTFGDKLKAGELPVVLKAE